MFVKGIISLRAAWRLPAESLAPHYLYHNQNSHGLGGPFYLPRLLLHTYNLPTEQASDSDERRMRALQALHRLRRRRGSKVNSLHVLCLARHIRRN
jgi:hypothetical protein